MKSIGHPDYVYCPMPQEQRDKIRQAHLNRRKHPDLSCIYGVYVPIKYAVHLRKIESSNRKKYGKVKVRKIVLEELNRLHDEQIQDIGWGNGIGVSKAYEIVENVIGKAVRG